MDKKHMRCMSDSDKAPVRMPKKPIKSINKQNKIRTGNVSGKEYS